MFWLRLIYTRLYGLLRKVRVEQEIAAARADDNVCAAR